MRNDVKTDKPKALIPSNSIINPEALNAGIMEKIQSGITEVTERIYSAKLCPRDEDRVKELALQECKNPELAAISQYSYPRGKTKVTGPSIRLIETIANCYGNLEYGVREVERRDGVSSMHAVAWDYERNVRKVIDWQQPHIIDTTTGVKHLHCRS